MTLELKYNLKFSTTLTQLINLVSIEEIPFVIMPINKACKTGTEIDTKSRCEEVLKYSSELDISSSHNIVINEKEKRVPSGCSIRVEYNNGQILEQGQLHFIARSNKKSLTSYKFKAVCEKGKLSYYEYRFYQLQTS